MYNVEEYVSGCLDNLLKQTFQDFEVIVVDDCSTDDSFKIVESYVGKFDGRLTLTKLEENSGGCALPRNRGLMLSRGEYVFFADADDALTKTALEELYTLAKDYDADLVYCERNYESPDLINMLVRGRKLVDKPTFESLNLHERFQRFLQGVFRVTAWLKFTKRNLLIENRLFFPHTCPGEDVIWTYALIFYAKTLLRIPNLIYIHQHNPTSVMTNKKTPKQRLIFTMNPLILGLKSLDELIGRHEFFKANPQFRYIMLKNLVHTVFMNIFRRNIFFESADFYETIKQGFGKYFAEHDVLISALCTALHEEKKASLYTAPIISKFSRYFTARIDIKLMSTAGDFQILSVSDDKAKVIKPDWYNKKDGTGYVIQSYVGNLEFVAKSTVDGQIRLNLLGLNVHVPGNKSKRIPYWVDYTKLTINGSVIFDTLTPAWHDKPYSYNIYVKAAEEVKIQIEWNPHRSDT